MVLALFDAGVGVALTAALAIAAVGSGALTRWAGAIAFLFGAVIVVIGGFPFLALLVLFVVASVLATRFRFAEKKRRNVHEGTSGERGVSNVVAHILIPTGLVLTAGASTSLLPPGALAVLYTSALAFGAADTFASEFGVLAGRARSILTFRPVEPGTNGGVSAIGELWALAGALTTSIVAVALFAAFAAPHLAPAAFLIVAPIGGFLGCQIDSVLGETLENRGRLTKGSTNFFGMLSAVAIAAALLLVFGMWR
ncbi:MAG: DUF92 domain-containing protein [Thermoplasmata archaeon]|nr:DUF92 domain-containing protein [Thermoplasmata archaeon]